MVTRPAEFGCTSPSVADFFTPATGRRNPSFTPTTRRQKPRPSRSSMARAPGRGRLLLPVPANGRGPEIALEFLRYGRTDIYVDDAMDRALRQLCTTDTASVRGNVDDDMKALAVTVKPIEAARGVMLAASADGTSGATKQLLRQWANLSEPAMVFTGYRAPEIGRAHV